MKNRNTFIFALVIFASVFLLTFVGTKEVFVGGTSLTKRPWDTQILFCFGDESWEYRLSDNIDGLAEDGLQDRLIFCNSALKAKWINDRGAQNVDTWQAFCYLFPNVKQTYEKIANKIERQAVDATITFEPNSQQKFCYTAEKKGCKINGEKLLYSLLKQLGEGKSLLCVKIPTEEILPKLDLLEAKKSTAKRGEFETDCSNSSKARQANVALALKFFNGLILKAGEEKSFNQVVGVRTAERGFAVAKVLQNGSYVDGVGGGVCQASTTLFNALLLADVRVKAVCQHSVKSSYVLPSFDAMVSDAGADLVFCNDTQGDIFIATSFCNGKVKVEIFGMPNQYQVIRRSVVKEKIPYKTIFVTDEKLYGDKVVFDDQRYVVKAGVEGIKSEGWLDYVKDGKVILSKRIRENFYKPIDEVVAKGAKPRPMDVKE